MVLLITLKRVLMQRTGQQVEQAVTRLPATSTAHNMFPNPASEQQYRPLIIFAQLPAYRPAEVYIDIP